VRTGEKGKKGCETLVTSAKKPSLLTLEQQQIPSIVSICHLIHGNQQCNHFKTLHFIQQPLVVTAYDDEDDFGKVLMAPDMAKYVMPLICLTMALERRLVTMNQGKPLPVELSDYLKERTSKGVEFLSFQEMVEEVGQLSKALKLDLPLSQQVRTIFDFKCKKYYAAQGIFCLCADNRSTGRVK
jgi:hypothetical protein